MIDVEELLKYSNIDLKSIQELTSKLKPLLLKKGESFLQEGDKVERVGLVLSGLLIGKVYR